MYVCKFCDMFFKGKIFSFMKLNLIYILFIIHQFYVLTYCKYFIQ